MLQGADAAVYHVGTWGGDQYERQAEGAGAASSIAAAQGASAFVYISAIGAEVDSESSYAATKAEGERRVLAAFPKATVLRPSILFGEDDAFLNMFAGLIARVPALPVFGSEARLQPLFVDDAAEAISLLPLAGNGLRLRASALRTPPFRGGTKETTGCSRTGKAASSSSRSGG